MKTPRFGDLEVLTRSPAGQAHETPLLFVHGAYTAAWCWEEHFLPYFADAGYNCYAVSLSGHGSSRGRAYLDSLAIDDFVNDVVAVAGKLPVAPVLIGHSMGGMVVQKYLERSEAAAAVLMASVPPQGLGASALGLAFRKPSLMTDLNRLLGGGQVAIDSLQDALFSQPMTPDLLLKYYKWMQPESFRAIWDMTLFNLPRPQHMNRPPMLILGAEHDQLIPTTLVDMTGYTYGLKPEFFPNMGHGMMLERQWETVAARIRDWLAEQNL